MVLLQTNVTMVIFICILAVVIPFLLFYLSKAKKEHPKGLIAAALSNMGERFGYYIMNAILLLFIVSKFGLPDATAGIIYSVFYFGIYVLSLVGGIIADRTQNYHRTIQWGLIIMALGYVGMAIPLFSQDANNLIVDGNGKWWGILIFTCVALLCIAFGTVCSRVTCRLWSARCTTTSRPKLPRKVPLLWPRPRTSATAVSRFSTCSSTSAA